jgi:tetratricopeptide (TPR) repeat protein
MAGPSPTPLPRLPSFSGGRYEAERVLSDEPLRRVYLAVDTRLGRRVAATTFDTRSYDAVSLARARRRVQAAARVGEHPNIVGIFDLEEQDGSVTIVTQFMPRGTVAELLARSTGGRLRRGDALRIAGQVAAALEHAHSCGMPHGALGTRRVWLAEDGSIKVGGFGAPGGAPEPADDIRALGALLSEMAGDGDAQVAAVADRLRADDPPDAAGARAALAEAATAAAPQPGSEQGARRAAPRPDRGTPRETRPLELLDAAFVGRARETAALRDAWAAASAGNGHLILVIGEPGIGKTRVLEDLDAHVRLEGAHVAWGRCYEGEGAPAFWPWIQVIRSYARACDPAALAEQMGDGAADIAQIVAEVRERIPGLTAPPSLEPQQARLRLFGAISGLLKAAAAREPLLVVLDDLHWADEPSLLMLRALSRELAGTRLLVAVSSRDDEAHSRPVLAQTLAALGRRAESRSVAMGGLDTAEVRAIVATLTEGCLRRDEERALAEELQGLADGNPYFVHETLRHLLETGRLVRRDDRWISVPGSVAALGVPDSVRELITRRLERLSGDGSRALVAASVIGREFELDVLEAVSGLGHDRLLEALAEASDARLAVAVRPGRRWTFAHALVRETLHDGLAGLRRARLHRRAGEALETLRSARAERHLAELAHHYREAGDAAKASAYAARAGAHAASLLAHEEAAEHYGHALRALDEVPDADDLRRCELLLALGEAQSRAGSSAPARDTFRDAAALARAGGDGERLARAALGWASGLGGFAYSSTSDGALIALLEEALEALGPEDSVERVQLLSRLAIELYYKPVAERRDSLTRDAVAMSRRLDDPRAQLVAQYGRHWALYGPDGLDERSAAGIELVRLADDVGDREMAFRGHHCLLATMLELGWTEAADHNLGACQQIAAELRQPLYTWHCETFRALRTLMDGKLEEGERVALEALRLGQRCHAEMAAVFCGTQLILVRTFQARLDELEPIVRQMSERYPDSSFGPALAFIHSELGEDGEARELFEGLAADGFAELRHDGNWLSSMGLLCNVANHLGDTERAALLYDALEPFDGRIIIGCAGSVTQGPVATYLGITARTLGRHDAAVAHLSDGVAQAQDVGVPFAVWARRELGQALLARDAPGDRERGEQELRGALADARRLGLVRETERNPLDSRG